MVAFLFFLTILLNTPAAISAPNKADTMLSNIPPSTSGKCLKIGRQAPNFSLPLVGGGSWELAKQDKNKSIVIVFYRGGWCPYCNLQLRTYDQAYQKIKAEKASLIAISVDQLDKKLPKPTTPISFPVASDPNLKVINAYNVAFKVPQELVSKYLSNYNIDLEGASGKKHHTIAMPSIAIIDQKRIIRWCYSNEDYKVRPATEVILRKLKEINRIKK